MPDPINKKTSLICLIILFSAIFIFRISHIHTKEISWDVLGYYLYLPATFIHHDPGLHSIEWLQKINDEQQLTATFYQVGSNSKGEPMYFFLMGMALFYLPFFFLGHNLVQLTQYLPDGFSPPYQIALVIGGLVYTLIGLIFLRKILLNYFSERTTVFTMLIIVLGTNYIHHLTIDNLATVNVLFMLMSILVWNTIQFHKQANSKNLVWIATPIFLMGLVKPSEIVALLIPLFWNVSSIAAFKDKMRLIVKFKGTILLCLLGGLILFFPQMYYWHERTGKWLYDSYKNPGVGLDLFSPHILEALFSYRKGWFIYTPVMIFSIIGFYILKKQDKPLFSGIFIYFLVTFYIICSWSEWWYGAAYSLRPMITSYPLLAICLGYFLNFISKKSKPIKYSIYTCICFLIILNQFQWWQLRHFILDPYRTTKEYYWAIFGKTYKDPAWDQYKLVERDFSGKFEFKNRENYLHKVLASWDFINDKEPRFQKDSTGIDIYRMVKEEEFSKTFSYRFNEITAKDHAWIEASISIRFPDYSFESKQESPLLVMSMEHKHGIYAYHALELKPDSLPMNWVNYKMVFLTPEMRSHKDEFKCYIWNRSKQLLEISQFKLDQYEPK